MKYILQKLSFIFLSFIFVMNAYAIAAPTNLELVKAGTGTLSISWEPVEGAVGYFVQFDKKSGANGAGYAMSVDDLIENNNVVIDALEPNTDYYVAITTIAENIDEDGETSQEAMFTTTSGDMAMSQSDTLISENFKLSNIEMTAFDALKIKFNSKLEDSEGVVREFKITNSKDEFEELKVTDVQLNQEDTTELLLTLEKDATIGEEYQVIVIALKDVNGRNIESGYDSVETFIVPESIDTVEFNAAETNTSQTVGESTNSIEGSQVDTVEDTTLSSAANIEKLPQTGPELILIFILTLILGTCLFVLKYKKS